MWFNLYVISGCVLQQLTPDREIDPSSIITMKTAIFAKLKGKFLFEDWHLSLSVVAAAIDPRFKKLKFIENQDWKQAVYDKVGRLYKRVITDFT